jgi:hypothetical protein
MARHCAVCTHPNCELIDRAVLANEPKSVVAKRHGLSDDTVERHVKSNHVRRILSQLPRRPENAPRTEAQMMVEASAANLVEKLQELITTAREIQARALAVNQFGAAMAGVRELSRIFELIARLTGQLDEGTRVNVLVQQQQERELERQEQLELLRSMSAEERGQLRAHQESISRIVEQAQARRKAVHTISAQQQRALSDDSGAPQED